MDEFLAAVASGWPALLLAILVFGFAPGFVLRLVLLLYPRGHDRRVKLLAELYRRPRIGRPMWVAEQIETALFEGPAERLRAKRCKRGIGAEPGETEASEAIVLERGRDYRDDCNTPPWTSLPMGRDPLAYCQVVNMIYYYPYMEEEGTEGENSRVRCQPRRGQFEAADDCAAYLGFRKLADGVAGVVQSCSMLIGHVTRRSDEDSTFDFIVAQRELNDRLHDLGHDLTAAAEASRRLAEKFDEYDDVLLRFAYQFDEGWNLAHNLAQTYDHELQVDYSSKLMLNLAEVYAGIDRFARRFRA